MEHSIFDVNNKYQLAYRRLDGQSPGLVFLHGYMGNMDGKKCLALEEFCRQRKRAFLCFDCRGHGHSSGELVGYCLSDWLEDSRFIFERFCDSPQILVGSSMGGWIMLKLALEYPQRVAGLVGLAAAPDFTSEVLPAVLGSELVGRVMTEGVVWLPPVPGYGPVPVTRKLVEDGEKHLLLKKGRDSLAIRQPLRLLHGLADKDIPWRTGQRLLDAVQSEDAMLSLLKGADHQLRRDADIRLIVKTIEGLLSALR